MDSYAETKKGAFAMAGLYDRVNQDTANGDRIETHLIVGSIKAVAGGIYSESQVVTKLNLWCTQNGKRVLTDADKQDISSICAEAETGTRAQRIDYVVAHVESAFTGAGYGLLNDAQWRTVLRI